LAVELVHWNPSRYVFPGRLSKVIRLTRPVGNFGDLLGPVIVNEILRRRGISSTTQQPASRLLSVGSIVHFAQDGDTVWGSGINAKVDASEYLFQNLDVRAVRGPLTRDDLVSRGISVPSVFGDPGLLVGHLWERDALKNGNRQRSYSIVPNFHDYADARHEKNVVNPRSPLKSVISQIAASDFVVGSSLHGIIVAESLGIPAQLVSSTSEPTFKYEDYYLGSGRTTFTPAVDNASALRLGGESPIQWDPKPLLASFPEDLWQTTPV
jgi:pyruvyltransferase